MRINFFCVIVSIYIQNKLKIKLYRIYYVITKLRIMRIHCYISLLSISRSLSRKKGKFIYKKLLFRQSCNSKCINLLLRRRTISPILKTTIQCSANLLFHSSLGFFVDVRLFIVENLQKYRT